MSDSNPNNILSRLRINGGTLEFNDGDQWIRMITSSGPSGGTSFYAPVDFFTPVAEGAHEVMKVDTGERSLIFGAGNAHIFDTGAADFAGGAFTLSSTGVVSGTSIVEHGSGPPGVSTVGCFYLDRTASPKVLYVKNPFDGVYTPIIEL